MTQNKYKILVVEDNPSDRELITNILGNMDKCFEVSNADSYWKAKQELEKNIPDLILLDIYLPDEDGFYFLEEFYKNGHRDIPVILVSAFPNQNDKMIGFSLGAIDFINKPIVTEDMKARVAVQFRLKKIKDDQQWANQKTNEGIKILYKELENKNKQLEKFDQLKDDFVNNVSHELRTPLTVVRESINLLMDGLLGEVSEKQKKYLSNSLVNIDYLTRIVNDLLDISKIEKGKLDILKDKVNIIELIEWVILNFKMQFEKKGLEIKFAPLSKDINVLADKERVLQVLINVLGNAYKFTQEGHVEILVIEGPTTVTCSIIDTGIGIDPTNLPKLFSRFYQIGRQFGPGMKGTGLGLAISKEIIELHDGEIHAQSVLGLGTTISFTMPKYSVKEGNFSNLSMSLNRMINKYRCFSLITFKIKCLTEELNEELNDLAFMIRNYLHRKSDQVAIEKQRVYIILPETDRANANLVAQRICHIIEKKFQFTKPSDFKGFGYSVLYYPQDGCTEDELIVKSENNKEGI